MYNSESINTLKDFFFADRVVESIEKNRKVDAQIEDLLNRILQYLVLIERGGSQVRLGKLVENPVESIAAYRKGVEVIERIPCPEKKEERIRLILKEVKKEVNRALKKKKISSKQMKRTHEFFKQASDLGIERISHESVDRQEPTLWQTHMPF
jgi:hypothetical protein